MNYETQLKAALTVLKSGGIIVYPTDTVWGIGADATNPKAVERILQLKNRSEQVGLIVLVERDSRLNRHVVEVPSMAWDLIDVTDEPLTIIYPEGRELADKVCAPDGSVAIRMVKDEFCIKLIQKLNKPLISTSANVSGQPAPSSISQIDSAILDGVDYTVNLRQSQTQSHRPSNIIKLDLDGSIKIIR